jgi:hypothetical protein
MAATGCTRTWPRSASSDCMRNIDCRLGSSSGQVAEETMCVEEWLISFDQNLAPRGVIGGRCSGCLVILLHYPEVLLPFASGNP